MLEKPDLQDDCIIQCLQTEYDLHAVEVVFLPLGADRNTAVYRVIAADRSPYFLKLRRADFDEVAVTLPKFLHDQGVAHIIAPLPTVEGRLWAVLDTYRVILYPFVEGRDGYEVELPEQGWTDLGATLRRIHAIELPPSLQGRIPREAFPSHWRDVLRLFMAGIAHETYTDPLSASVAAFLRERSDRITHLVERADTLADRLRAQPPEYVMCHYDLHAGNLLIAPDAFYIVDWDNPLLAPKERDLMFIGGGLLGGWHAPSEEEALFYHGYGPTQIHPAAMAYYRYARIVEDIAVECEQIFQLRGSIEDREQEYSYLIANFAPNGVLDLAYRTDQSAGGT